MHCHSLQHLEARIVRYGFSRGEFYNFPAEHLPALKQFIDDMDIIPSVHCPLRQAPWYPHPVTWSYLSTDVHHTERELSFRLVEQTMRDAVDLRAAYVVVHYPTPASPEAGQMTLQEQRDVAWSSAGRLSELVEDFGVPVCIEGFGPSPFMTSEFITSVLKTFPNLRYCFDTGHMALMAQRDGLDFFGFLEAVGPYLGCVHIWNTRGFDDYKAYHHLPPHPGLKPSEGWVDMERVVTTVRQASPSAVFVLEHSTDMPSEFGLDHDEGIEWFRDLVNSTVPETTEALSEESASVARHHRNAVDDDARNIVLTGFMGVGKTRVGQEVAARLERPFIDMDDVLEERFGMSIPTVFETRGETVFREQEAVLSMELAKREGLVISTGGGTLIPEANRRAFERSGLVICLQCAPDEIIRRVGEAGHRPMLEGADLHDRISTLLEKRRPAYDSIPHQIDTTCMTVDQVADAVVALWSTQLGRDDRAAIRHR